MDCVITEDSDLLMFGCKKVLFETDEIGGGHDRLGRFWHYERWQAI